MTFWNPSSRKFLACLPFTLPITFALPYAVFVERLRVLIWVWQQFYLPFWLILAFLSLGALLCSFLLIRLLPGALTVYAICLVCAIAQPSYLAMKEHRHFLLVFIFLLLCGQVYIFEYLRNILALPFYSSKRAWWEAYPKALPNLYAIVYENKAANTEGIRVRLSNFGRAGCFVFSEACPILFTPQQVVIKSSQGTLLERPVELAVRTGDAFGVGLRFRTEMAGADWCKDLEDYLSYLRRSGYVDR